MSMLVRQVRLAALTLLGLATISGMLSANEKVEVRAVEERLKKDLFYLASDELEGRGAATEGLEKAARYIADEFKKTGLKPAGQNGTYFQHFTIPGGTLTQPATLAFNGPKATALALKQGVDFNPLGISKSASHRDVGIVFAGFGVSRRDYDDFKGLDAAGKVVVVLREAPKFFSAPDRDRYGRVSEKIKAARAADALALVLVNNEDIASDGDDLLNFNFWATARIEEPFPTFHVKRAVIDRLLASAGDKSLAKLEKAINDEKQPVSLTLNGWACGLDLKVRRDGIEHKNVIGVLEGKGPLAKETVVIGAHYDHLGYGGYGTRGPLKKMVIHNGADDNGSGTTAVLELARRFAASKEREGRRIVFMTFAGEELGLLGSAHYCKAPIFPLEDTVIMLNLDMVGRLTKNASGQEPLEVWGTGSAKGFDRLIDEFNRKYKFSLTKVPGGGGPSDHASFYANKIPVYFFFTKTHPDYHRPSDDADRINYDGMRRIIDMVEEMGQYFTTVKDRPEYVRVAGTATTPRPGGGIRLGIQPSYSDKDKGLLIEDVVGGGLAAKAGLKAGDRIMKMGDRPIEKIEHYMEFMAKQKKGDTIEVMLIREKKELKLKINLE